MVHLVLRKGRKQVLDDFFGDNEKYFANWSDVQSFALKDNEVLLSREPDECTTAAGRLPNIDYTVILASGEDDTEKKNIEKICFFSLSRKELIIASEL